MENTTKALLITGAVLITIVLIALGVLLVKNTSGTSKQADVTGQLLSNATDKATISVSGGLKGLVISKEKFNKAFEKWQFTSKDQLNSEIALKNEKLKDQIELIGWVYNDIDYFDITIYGEFATLTKEEAKLQWCIKKEQEGKISRLKNPLDNEEIKKKCKNTYEEKTNNSEEYYSFDDYCKKFQELPMYAYKPPIRQTYFWMYDETGYISKIYFLAGIIYDENTAKKIINY